MRGIALALAIMIGSASASATLQDPFDRYIATVKQHRPAESVAQFAQACGVNLRQSQPEYTMHSEKWIQSRNLPKDVYDAESDFLTTAELWKSDHAVLIVHLWMTDVESDQKALFCFDSYGNVKFLSSTNWSLPYDNGKRSFEWAYVQRLSFAANGKLIRKVGNFVDQKGAIVPRPKVDRNDLKDFDFVPGYRKLSDFGFPRTMLD